MNKENQTEQELMALKKKLSNVKLLVKNLIENSRPVDDPSKESVYYCAEAFLQGELESI
jgi:hypothetical protein